MLNRKLKSIVSFVFALCLCFALAMPAWAADINSEQGFSQEFLINAKCTLTEDEQGYPLIMLEDTQPVIDKDDTFIKTTAVILPEDSDEAIEIVDNIQSIKEDGLVSLYGSGTIMEDDWYLGSSVYLKSVVTYTTQTVENLNFGHINNVEISVSTNSGTTISSLKLLISQRGLYFHGYAVNQSQEYNAMTQRSFTPPSDWVDVLWDFSSNVVATLSGYAQRPNGQTTSIVLYNVVW